MNRKLQLQNFIQKLTGSLSLSDFKKLVKEAERTIPGFLGEVENWPKEEKQLAEKIFKDVFYKRLNICKTFRYD
jgi:hypothetical protein